MTTLPAYLNGVTWDDVSKVDKINAFLISMPKPVISRVVFDEKVAASYYVKPLTTLVNQPIMGELLDSEYVKTYSVDKYIARAQEYLSALGNLVSLWEVGNEINGEWLGTTADVIAKVRSAYTLMKAAGKKTAITFYYNSGCYSKADHEMFTWITKYFPKDIQPDYALISYYEDDCNNLKPNWPVVFDQFASIFPNSKVGMGECGTKKAALKSEYLTRYYSMHITNPNYIGGNFWWYGAEDFLGANPSLVNLYKTLLK